MSGLLHRRILLDGAVFLRHYRTGMAAGVVNGDASFVADLDGRLTKHLGAELPEEPKPCRVVQLADRERPPRTPIPFHFLQGERQNGQRFFYWLDMRPGAELHAIENYRR